MSADGGTPHRSVLLEEAVDALAVKPDGVYVDATFGRGGHSALILRRLGAAGRLIALDRDPQAVAAANAVADGRLAVRHAAFSGLLEVLHAMGIAAVDGVLLDLGVSSPQLDDPARGMSFRFDAPLDMRMDTSCGMTAAQWLAQAGQREIEEVIRNYGEERFAAKVAKAIVAARGRGPVTTTRQLAEIVAQAVPTREQGQHPATRSFQAVRIFVNQELEELSLVLPQCIEALRPAGRLVVICFHSLEDRLVKRFLRGEAKPQLPSRLPLRARELPQPRIRLVGKAARPDAGQIADNPRARSAIMRVAERI